MSLTKISGSGDGSGFVNQMYGSADPDPGPYQRQNVTDPQHCILYLKINVETFECCGEQAAGMTVLGAVHMILNKISTETLQ